MLNLRDHMTTIKIAPSILAADFARLGDQIRAAAAAGADQIHIDIMDGHFVPNLSMGPAVVQAVRHVTELPFDVHLMIDNPEMFIDPFARAGANSLNFHIEVASDAPKTIDAIHAAGLHAGIAIRPSTDLATLANIYPLVDIVLVMTVEPGFGGQHFLEVSPARIAEVRSKLDAISSKADITVDGGIDASTAGVSIRSGATVLVAGTSVFRAQDGIKSAVQRLRDAARP
jgi:ribulose-phosphate 3-epimerase